MKESHSCNYDPELFFRVKESVTMQQAVEHCGISVNQKGLAMCPFHQDKHPSLKIYPNGKGFYCFACGAGGDQIKFVARYHDIGNYEAAKQLAMAYGVPMQEPVTYREKREAQIRQQKRQALREFAAQAKMYLTVYYGLLCGAIRARDRHFCEGLDQISWTLYMLEQIDICPETVYADEKAVRKIGEVKERVAGWFEDAGEVGAVSG